MRFFNFVHNGHDSGIFREIPLPAKKKLYASPMPMALEQKTAEEAIDYVKHHMTINITTEQKSIIKKFESFL